MYPFCACHWLYCESNATCTSDDDALVCLGALARYVVVRAARLSSMLPPSTLRRLGTVWAYQANRPGPGSRPRQANVMDIDNHDHETQAPESCTEDNEASPSADGLANGQLDRALMSASGDALAHALLLRRGRHLSSPSSPAPPSHL